MIWTVRHPNITTADSSSTEDSLATFVAWITCYVKVGDLPPWPPMSAEVVVHLAQQHPCRGDTPAQTLTCPCGHSWLIVCGECDEPVLLFVHPDHPICPHAGPYLEEEVA